MIKQLDKTTNSRKTHEWAAFMNRLLMISSTLACFCATVHAGVTVSSVEAIDELGRVRTSYSSSEKIGFQMTAQLDAASASRLQFSFSVTDPTGATVLTQTGSSTPGSQGTAGASIKNISVNSFFKGSGNYTVTGRATLGGLNSQKSIQFRVSAPIINLSYPVNGARNLTDKPITFRWVGTGSARYRILVDDDRSFYNAIFVAETTGTSFTYPLNPTSAVQRLVSGQVYYWKVDGIDGASNITGETNLPFSFSLANEAASTSTLDAGIVRIARTKTSGQPGQVPLEVVVENRGGRSIQQLAVNLLINGMPVDTQQHIIALAPGQQKSAVFQYRPGVVAEQLLCVATLGISDDDLKNNTFSARLRSEDLFPSGKAQIHGAVVQSSSSPPKKIANAQVFYEGAKRGYVFAEKGVYKIEKLPVGEYTIFARSLGYNDSSKVSVSVKREISYTGIDLKLIAQDIAASKPRPMGLREAWLLLKPKLSPQTRKALEGYEPVTANDLELLRKAVQGAGTIEKEKIK